MHRSYLSNCPHRPKSGVKTEIRSGVDFRNGVRGRISVSRFFTKVVIVSAFILVVVLVGIRAGAPGEVRAAGEKSSSTLYDELKTFTDVLALVQRDYVREVDSKKLIEGAIKGMLTTLDPHSGYLDPDFYQDLQVQTRGEFGGLGIEITIREGALVVVAPMEGSPAEKAGVRSGDTIVKIDGKFAKEFSLVDAVKKLRGPKGSVVLLSLHRKGYADLLDVSVARENIQMKSVRSRYLGDGYGYARISQFMEKTTEDLKHSLQDMKQQAPGGELHGLILDLRNNPGGLLTQAIGVGDLFLKEGIIVYTDGRVEKQKQKFYAHGRNTEPEYPMIVLVNGGSASAAEIVAGAFKDHGRALILGTQTFGKGSVQTITPLDNGGAVTLTTALYYTKSGQSIQATGVKPDILIDTPPANVAGLGGDEKEEGPPRVGPIREGDLPGAINNPNGIVPHSEKGENRGRKAIDAAKQAPVVDPVRDDLQTVLKSDPQLQKAFELLKTFNIFTTVQREGATVGVPSF